MTLKKRSFLFKFGLAVIVVGKKWRDQAHAIMLVTAIFRLLPLSTVVSYAEMQQEIKLNEFRIKYKILDYGLTFNHPEY